MPGTAAALRMLMQKPSLIDRFMPEYRMRQTDRIRVRATPSAAWQTVRALDLGESPISRALFALRGLPEKLLGRKTETSPARQGIEGFTGPGKGFKILAEEPGSEIVIGSVGKFWKPSIEWAEVDSDTFEHYRVPGFGKLAWNLRVDPDSQGGSWITWDLRVGSTDHRTWAFFQLYWLLIGTFSHWLRRTALRRFARKLGGAVGEEDLRIPGDEKVPNPRYQKTLSVSIEAPPAKVWPWLVQMGCQRAGWYSIDALDNGGRESAREIVPDLQSIEVGQVLPWKPEGNEGFTVLGIRENEVLILGTPGLLKGPHRQETPLDDCWVFFLEPLGANATRLSTRVRADYRPTLGARVLTLWLPLAHSVMERAQLRNLKKRIERPVRSSAVLSKEAPDAQFKARVEIDVDADSALVLQSFRQVTLSEMPLARFLGTLRYLAGRILGRQPPAAAADRPFLATLLQAGSVLLSESETEIVLASAGKYHQWLSQEPVPFATAEAFRQFTDVPFQKLLISVRVEPLENSRSKIILEHWTWALSESSKRKFAMYWKVIRPMGGLVSWLLLRAVRRRAETASGPHAGSEEAA